MIMRFNEIHKFSDGTLQQINEALDYRVKEFKVNGNEYGFEHTDLETRKECRQKQGFMFANYSKKENCVRQRRISVTRKALLVAAIIREGDYRLLQRTE
ncbi:hypothetical protein Tco_0111789 [Tanacetum coccineum]